MSANEDNTRHPRIEYGYYGGKVQNYITGVDGTVARLGNKRLPSLAKQTELVAYADAAHRRLCIKQFVFEKKDTDQ